MARLDQSLQRDRHVRLPQSVRLSGTLWHPDGGAHLPRECAGARQQKGSREGDEIVRQPMMAGADCSDSMPDLWTVSTAVRAGIRNMIARVPLGTPGATNMLRIADVGAEMGGD